MRVIPLYGGTEFGTPVGFRNCSGDAKDWEYVSFSPLVKTRWDDQGDGTLRTYIFWFAQFSVFLTLIADADARVREQTCNTH